MLLGACQVEPLLVEGGSVPAVMESDQTRTSVTDEGAFTWSAGDQIWLETTFGNVTGTLSSGAGTANAIFSYGTYIGDMTGRAVYPYNSGHSMSENVLKFVLPASYDLGSNISNTNAAVYGVDVDGTIRFNHLAGVMRFIFKKVPVGTDRFQITLDKKINGEFAAELTETFPVIETSAAVSDSEKTVTLNFDALTSVSDICLYVPLPVGTYTTLGLELWAGEKSLWSYSNTVTNKIGRKTLKLMPVINMGGSIGGELEGGQDPDISAIYDSFNRGNTTSGIGTSDSGHIWKHYTGDEVKMYIHDGKVFASKDYPSAYCALRSGDHNVQAKVSCVNEGQLLLYTRYDETTGKDYVAVRVKNDKLTLLAKKNAVNEELQSISASQLPSFPYTLKVDVVGNTHNVYVNDELMISHDIVYLSDNANVGFSINGNGNYIDDFSSDINVAKPERKSVSLLFVGNSLTQDGIAYLPYMLKNYYPEVDFKIYMWYIASYTLGQQYDRFINNGYANIFSVAENTESWTNYSNKTMASVLSSYSFDMVCMQEYFKIEREYTVQDWNNCQDYIISNYKGGNDLEFISLFHAPLRNGEYDTDQVYARTEAGNALILQTTDATDMIPNGIAVYRALQTELDVLGDKQHLSPDGVHTQEGLPCLLQTYVTLCWLFDRLAIDKSVYGHPMRMTPEIYKRISVPGANLGSGVITGTDAQNILAQEVAINAYREGKEFVNSLKSCPQNQ